MRPPLTIACVFLCALPVAYGLGPHEIALLVNEDSPDSKTVAESYANLRKVPRENIIALRPAGNARETPLSISVEDFRERIFDPAQAALVRRGLDDHVLAWVYSVGFPTRISGSPDLSLTGATFVRGRAPRTEAVERGTFVSPLFCGPSGPGGVAHFAQSLDVTREWIGVDMPLPAMVLGHTGPRGNRVSEVLAGLRRGAASDATSPSGTVYLVEGSDVRARCRQWEFVPAAEEILRMGVDVRVVDRPPARAARVAGVMMGAAQVDPAAMGTFVPGAVGDHLTSLAGVFDGDGQTKLTAWIAAGATAAAGTVTEPYAIWMKFPHARIFAHQAAGCTVIESYYQAVRCPLQLLIAGDPLAAPWAPCDAAVTLEGMPAGPWAGEVRVSASVAGAGRAHYSRLLFLVDGRVRSREPVLWLDARPLASGRHTLRAVAYRTGFVRHQIFAEHEFEVGAKP